MNNLLKITIIILFISCNSIKNKSLNSQISEVKLINNSSYTLDNISIFSTKFGSLKSNYSTNYKNILFKVDSTNSTISLKSNGKLFTTYIQFYKNKKVIYYIDSIVIDKQFMLIRDVVE